MCRFNVSERIDLLHIVHLTVLLRFAVGSMLHSEMKVSLGFSSPIYIRFCSSRGVFLLTNQIRVFRKIAKEKIATGHVISYRLGFKASELPSHNILYSMDSTTLSTTLSNLAPQSPHFVVLVTDLDPLGDDPNGMKS